MQKREERNSLNLVLDVNKKNIVQVSVHGGGVGEAGEIIESSVD